MAVRVSSRKPRQRRGDAGDISKPDAWSHEEDDTLRDGVARFGPKRWRAISNDSFANGERSADACRARWIELTHHGQAADKRKWTSQEDRRLEDLVTKYHEENWALVASFLRGRNAKQCRERWQNQLRPDLKRDVWTHTEDSVIAAMQAKIGNKWATIARELAGRTDNMVKNRWYSTLSRDVARSAVASVRVRDTTKPRLIKAKTPPPVAAAKPKAKRKRAKLFGASSKRTKKKLRVHEKPPQTQAQSPDRVDGTMDGEDESESSWVSLVPALEATDEDGEPPMRILLEEMDPLILPHHQRQRDNVEDDWALAGEALPILGSTSWSEEVDLFEVVLAQRGDRMQTKQPWSIEV